MPLGIIENISPMILDPSHLYMITIGLLSVWPLMYMSILVLHKKYLLVLIDQKCNSCVLTYVDQIAIYPICSAQSYRAAEGTILNVFSEI